MGIEATREPKWSAVQNGLSRVQQEVEGLDGLLGRFIGQITPDVKGVGVKNPNSLCFRDTYDSWATKLHDIADRLLSIKKGFSDLLE